MQFQKKNLQKLETKRKLFRLITRLFLYLTLLCCFFLKQPTALAKEIFSQEYMIKAAFIYNFAKFIEWPSSTSLSPNFNVCILGADPFGKEVETIKGKKIGMSKISVSYIKSIEEFPKIKDCQILFISYSEKHNIAAILNKTDRLPILTIADQKNAAQSGVIINFIVEDKKVRFEINNREALKAGIKIRSDLLNLAMKIVD